MAGLVGIDALDTFFRLERSFGVKFDKGLWDRIPQDVVVEPVPWWSCDPRARRSSNAKWRYERRTPTATAGDVHTAVCAELSEKGIEVPADSWPRVRQVLSDVTGHPFGEITAESRLFADLGFE